MNTAPANVSCLPRPLAPKPGWFAEVELANPWNDPGLVAAIDRSVAPAGANEGRRVTDEPEGGAQ